MTKIELIAEVASQSGHSRAAVDAIRAATSEVITARLYGYEDVIVPGLGKLKPIARSPRTGRNPNTGAQITIPAKVDVKFTPAKALADALNSVSA